MTAKQLTPMAPAPCPDRWSPSVAIRGDYPEHPHQPELGHREIGLGIAFAPDGATFATTAGDGTIKIWRTPKP